MLADGDSFISWNLLAIVGLAILFQPWRPYWRQRKTLSAIVVTISAAAFYIMLYSYEQANSANGYHWRFREILIPFSVIVAWWDALRKKQN